MKLLCDPMTTSSRPVLFLIAHCGLAVEVERLSLRAGDTRTPAFRTLNPLGKVPVLVVGDAVLRECSAILRYLATDAAPALYSGDPLVRARIDEALSLFGTDFYTAQAIMTVYPAVLNHDGFAPEVIAALRDAAAPRREAILAASDARLAEEPWIAGPALSIADFLAVSYVMLGALIGDTLDRWPHLADWADRMRALPGFAESFAPFDAMVAARRAASGG